MYVRNDNFTFLSTGKFGTNKLNNGPKNGQAFISNISLQCGFYESSHPFVNICGPLMLEEFVD